MIFERLKISNPVWLFLLCFCVPALGQEPMILRSPHGALKLDNFFYETAAGRTVLPSFKTPIIRNRSWTGKIKVPNGTVATLAVTPSNRNFVIRLSAQPSTGIVKWGLTIDSRSDEYYTGLMERVVDGPQAASWAPGRKEAMDLRGQKVEMILKPTTSVYAPFYLSSRGYAIFVKGNWPGYFDFAASDPDRVKIEFEGPSFEMKVYTASHPADLVRQHALDTGPPFLPPKWMFTPWRWRDEHKQRPAYYDGTPVSGPFNSEIMEDVLLMKAYGIPNGVYWIDRPWGPGLPWGYDDFEIDHHRLPHFAEMVKWLNGNGTKTVLWIAPFFQGEMAKVAHAACGSGATCQREQLPDGGFDQPCRQSVLAERRGKTSKTRSRRIQVGSR